MSKQPNTITVTFCEIDGEDLMDLQGVSLLLGLPVEQLREKSCLGSFPAEWMKQARRRASEAQAHTGSNGLFEVLTYWAWKDYDADVEFVDQD